MSASTIQIARSKTVKAVTLDCATPASFDEPSLASFELEFEIVSDPDHFERIAADWNDLHTNNDVNQLTFQSHAWLRAWLTTRSSDPASEEQVAIITGRRNQKLQIICPFAVTKLLGMVHLTWFGQPASQYGDVLCADTIDAPAIVEAAMNFALETIAPDIVHLRKVREDAAILNWRECNARSLAESDTAHFLDLHDAKSFEAYSSRYSAKARKNRRRLRRRLEETNAVTIDILPSGKASREALATAVDFKRQWLVDRGHVSSALNDPHFDKFISEFVSQNSPMAEPFVSVMRCGPTPVSIQFGIITKRRLALHMIAFNPATEKSGAGVLHIEDTIAHCISNDLVELDFLAPEAAYKRDWSDGAIAVADYVLPLTIKGRLYAQAYLSRTRSILKSRMSALPLPIRQGIAKQLQRPSETSA